MIGISTQLFDLEGSEVFVGSSISGLDSKVTRRVLSTATLDGGSYVSDQGYSDSDRRLNFEVLYLPQERVDNMIRIAKVHSIVFVCTEEGAFLGTISQIYYRGGRLYLNFIIRGAA